MFERILVVGSGAREHALCWALAREPGVTEVLSVPGNAGTALVARNVCADGADVGQLRALVERERVDLTVVGPELPLTQGLANELVAAGHPVVGPSKEAAELESSKAFAKGLMTRHGVPTARYVVCTSPAAARDAIRSGAFGYPVVLKADGLAAGKGVVVARDEAGALAAAEDIMETRRFGDAGSRLVVEECLVGREASFFAVTDGRHVVVLPSAEDHKRAFDDDQGPNTGGMGAFSPSPLIDGRMRQRVLDEIVEPTLWGMESEGRRYAGFLYVGLMLTAEGPKVVEFNARMGDPESQVVLPAVEGGLLATLVAAARGTLAPGVLPASSDRFVGVVMASGGYPDRYETGKTIGGLEHASALTGVLVFHAGTAMRDGRVMTSGGRVLTVVGKGSDFAAARARAYDGAAAISFDGMFYRRDIGLRAVDSRQ
ncbi:MAG: phosphoribosylamine--glycine ligase [Acidobacteriota bacterium]